MRVLSLLPPPPRPAARHLHVALLVAVAARTVCGQGGADATTTPPPAATVPDGQAPALDAPAPDAATPAPARTMLRLAEAEERRLRRRFADLLVERAIEVLGVVGGPASNLDLGVEIVQIAAAIDPDDPDVWRVLLQMADLVERPEVARRALDQLGRIDPSDESVTLRRLAGAIDRIDTVEQRVAAYEKILGQSSPGWLGTTLASRLALDRATLLRRAGDIDGFARWLAESVALDPANPAAASALTEFFASATDDPAALAELMIARCLADPANLPAIEQLGAFLLARGAPVGARRVLQLAVDVGGGPRSVSPQTLALLAIATWLAGDPEAALSLIDLRQRSEDAEFRQGLNVLRHTLAAGETGEEALLRAIAGLSAPAVAVAQGMIAEGELTAERVAAATAPLWPDLAATRAAIQQVRGVTDAAAAARALVTVEMLDVQLAAAASGEPERRAAAIADAAWWTLFLGEDVPAARQALEQAAAIAPLDERTTALANGWMALREGRLEDAVAAMTSCAEVDPRCELGLGVALLRREERKAGATRLLSAARAMSGTVAGAWALETLYKSLGSRVPAWQGAAELESMAATLPPTFDRLLLDPQRELSIVVRPAATVFGPFDRIEATIEVDNRSALPLAIGPDGPIRDTVAMPFVKTSYGVESSTGPLASPGLVDIGRRVALGPRSSMSVRANLSRCLVGPGQTLGTLVRNLALQGSGTNLNSRAVLNPVPVEEATVENRLVPGILGVESAPLNFRVEHQPFDAAWRVAAIAAVETIDRFEDLELLATLAARIAQADVGGLARLQPDQRAAVESALREQVAAVEKALPQLPPLAQAWLTMHLLPNRPLLGGIEAALRGSSDPAVRLASLISLTAGNQDPLLDQTRRGDDPALQRIAELLSRTLRRSSAPSEPTDDPGR